MSRKEALHMNRQFRDAAIFILLSILLVCGVLVLQDGTQSMPSDAQAAAGHIQAYSEDVPAEVLREADSCATREWEYVRRAFPERSYCAYKLDVVHHVLTCRHAADETFEVYGITSSYRRDDHEEWERAENAAAAFWFSAPAMAVPWNGSATFAPILNREPKNLRRMSTLC